MNEYIKAKLKTSKTAATQHMVVVSSERIDRLPIPEVHEVQA
jgi:hypothetical protein